MTLSVPVNGAASSYSVAQMEEILPTHTNTHKDAFIEPIMVMVDTHTQRTWTRKHTHAYYYLKAAISESAAVTEKLSLEAWRVLEDDGSTGS